MAIKFLNTVQVDTDVLYVDAANDRVGIGTTSPSSKLQVEGNILIPNFGNIKANGTGYLSIGNTNGGEIQIGGDANDSTIAPAFNNLVIQTERDIDNLIFKTGASVLERMRIDSSTGNVGIGTTSPSTKLDVSSGNFGATAPTVRITNTLNVGNWSGVTGDLGRFEFFTDDTSGNAPYTLGYIGIKNDITTGVPALPSGAMVFATTTFNASGGAVERMRISSTGDVGIGTTSPDSLLNLEGAKNTSIITLGSTTNDSSWSVGDKYGAIDFYSGDGSGAGAGIKASISYEVEAGSTGSTNSMVFRSAGTSAGTNNTERMRITAAGALIIKDTGGTKSLSLLRELNYATINNGVETLNYNALSHIFLTGLAEKMRIASNGNVGIGTTSPGERLEITGSTPTAGDTTLNLKVPAGNITIGVTEMGNILFSSSDASTGGSGSVAKISTIAGDGSGAWTGNGRPTDLAFFTQPLGASATLVESMRIDQDGNVGIGTTSPGAKLDVRSLATTAETVAQFGNNNIQGGLEVKTNGNLDWGFNTKNSRNLTFSTNQTERMRITSAGNVGIGTTSPGGNLHVVGASGNSGRIYLSDKDNGVGGGQALLLTKTGVNSYIYNRDSGDLRLGTNDQFSYVTIKPTGDVGIGTDSPGALLHVRAATNVTGTIEVQGGKAIVTSVGEINSELNFGSNDSSATGGIGGSIKSVTEITNGAYVGMSFYTANQQRTPVLEEAMRIDSYGNVGIGNTNPSDYSADANNLVVGSLSGNNGITILSTASSGYGSLYFADATTSNKVYSGFIRYQQNQSVMNFGTNEVERMRIDVNGNVGIGTTSPTATLDVNGEIAIRGGEGADDARMYFRASDNSNRFTIETDLDGTTSNDLLVFRGSATDNILVLKGNGNVGMGTTNPATKLHVSGGDIRIDDTERIEFGAGGVRINNDAAGRMYLNAPLAYYWQAGSGYRMVLLNSGNLGIGTTSPGSLLEVKGSTNSTTSNLLRLVREVDSSQPHKVAAFYSGVNERGSITVNSFATAYNTSSDYRLKENIKSIDNSVDRLMSLNPCSFNFKSTDKNKLVIDGFIAHEAQEVVPEAVTGLKDAIDKNGDPIYQSIDQSKLIPLLTAALQEAIERIKALENKINK